MTSALPEAYSLSRIISSSDGLKQHMGGLFEETDVYLGSPLCSEISELSWIFSWVSCLLCRYLRGVAWRLHGSRLPFTLVPSSHLRSQHFPLTCTSWGQLWFQLIATWGHFRFWDKPENLVANCPHAAEMQDSVGVDLDGSGVDGHLLSRYHEDTRPLPPERVACHRCGSPKRNLHPCCGLFLQRWNRLRFTWSL